MPSRVHPALWLDNVSQLPIYYRRYASNAANGSLADLQKLVALLANKPYAKPEHFLPVAFLNLNPDRIPPPEQVDSIEEYTAAIQRAFLSLQLLDHCRPSFLPGPFHNDIWPRLWAWLWFLHSYSDVVRRFLPLTEMETHNLYMKCILDYEGFASTPPIRTPGVRVVVGRAWVFFLSMERGIHQTGFHDVVRFLYDDSASIYPANIQEYIDAMGGTRGDFAVLAKRHFDRTFPSADGYPLSETTVFFLTGLLRLLIEHGGDAALTRALISHDVLSAITEVIRIYAQADPVPDGAEEVMSKCFTLLVQKADVPGSHQWIAEALSSDRLIQGIVACGRRAVPGVEDSIRHLLDTVLPRSLVHYSVLIEIDREVDWKDHSDTLFPGVRVFPDVELFALWEQFNKSATEFVHIFQSYHGGYYFKRRACDNMKCGRFCERHEIRRCSACRQAYYCSVECQTIDWRDDGHVRFCARLRAQALNDPDGLRTRENSFMHALVRHEYDSRFCAIGIQQITFMHEHPGTPFFTLIDYTRGGPTITVRPVHDYADLPDSSTSDVRWEDQVSRVVRSGGRMDLVVMAVADGARTRYRMDSVRSYTSDFHQSRKRIAAALPGEARGLDLDLALSGKAEELFDERCQNGDQFLAWATNYATLPNYADSTNYAT